MNTDKIFIFTGKYLEHNFTVSPTALNHFISKDESVGKLIDDKEIKEALEWFVTIGWLELEKSDPVNPIYKRYVTEYEKKKYGREYAAKEKKK